MVAFHAGDDADVPEAYDPNGWTWEKNFFENECANDEEVQYDITGNNGDDFEIVAPCDEAIATEVELNCELTLNELELSACCDDGNMGDVCDALLSDCITDVCAIATVDGVGYLGLIQPAIDTTLVAAIEAVCAVPEIASAFEEAEKGDGTEALGEKPKAIWKGS